MRSRRGVPRHVVRPRPRDHLRQQARVGVLPVRDVELPHQPQQVFAHRLAVAGAAAVFVLPPDRGQPGVGEDSLSSVRLVVVDHEADGFGQPLRLQDDDVVRGECSGVFVRRRLGEVDGVTLHFHQSGDGVGHVRVQTVRLADLDDLAELHGRVFELADVLLHGVPCAGECEVDALQPGDGRRDGGLQVGDADAVRAVRAVDRVKTLDQVAEALAQRFLTQPRGDALVRVRRHDQHSGRATGAQLDPFEPRFHFRIETFPRLPHQQVHGLRTEEDLVRDLVVVLSAEVPAGEVQRAVGIGRVFEFERFAGDLDPACGGSGLRDASLQRAEQPCLADFPRPDQQQFGFIKPPQPRRVVPRLRIGLSPQKLQQPLRGLSEAAAAQRQQFRRQRIVEKQQRGESGELSDLRRHGRQLVVVEEQRGEAGELSDLRRHGRQLVDVEVQPGEAGELSDLRRHGRQLVFVEPQRGEAGELSDLRRHGRQAEATQIKDSRLLAGRFGDALFGFPVGDFGFFGFKLWCRHGRYPESTVCVGTGSLTPPEITTEQPHASPRFRSTTANNPTTTRSSSARLNLNSADSARLGIEEIRCWTINRRDSPANERLSGAVPWSEQATSRVSRSELVAIQSARVPNWDVENWCSPVLIFICRSNSHSARNIACSTCCRYPTTPTASQTPTDPMCPRARHCLSPTR